MSRNRQYLLYWISQHKIFVEGTNHARKTSNNKAANLMAIDPGTTLILITCLICTIVLAFAGKETGDKTDTRHDNEQRKRKR